MTALADILKEIGICQYLETFVEHGFDTWEIFAEITEQDFDILGVKLGHRRKIQRKIASLQGIAPYQPLASPITHTPSEDRRCGNNKATVNILDTKDDGINAPTGKRRYRRHPKPDEKAPKKPSSAYVIFSNKMRNDLSYRNVAFTEMAKFVGENWQALLSNEKEPFEAQALSAKEQYNADTNEYRKTDSYRLYVEYLADFREKHPSRQQADRGSKRQRFDDDSNSGSRSCYKSATQSQHRGDIHAGQCRIGSVCSPAPPSNGGNPSPSPSPSIAQLPSLAGFSGAHGVSLNIRGQGSPNTFEDDRNIMHGRHDAVFGTIQQTLVRRENTHGARLAQPQAFLRITNIGDQRSEQFGTSSSRGCDDHILQSSTNSNIASPPPILSSESASVTTSCLTSGLPVVLLRTPLASLLDRSLPITQLYNAEQVTQSHTQIPRFRTSTSLVLPRTVTRTDNSASIDLSFPSRGEAASDQQPIQFLQGFSEHTKQLTSGIPLREERLDPFSTLLLAIETVSRTT